MDSELKVAPPTPAHKRRTKLVSGLTGQTCKLSLIFNFLLLVLIFIFLSQRWLLLPKWDGVSSW